MTKPIDKKKRDELLVKPAPLTSQAPGSEEHEIQRLEEQQVPKEERGKLSKIADRIVLGILAPALMKTTQLLGIEEVKHKKDKHKADKKPTEGPMKPRKR